MNYFQYLEFIKNKYDEQTIFLLLNFIRPNGNKEYLKLKQKFKNWLVITSMYIFKY